jgi:tRNA A58 N-methylase Trm61
LVLVDHGAGKSYLGFILYDLLLKNHPEAHVYGIEFREQLVKSSEALAQKLGFSDGMSFKAMSVEEAMSSTDIPAKVDITTALHACDTATDDAIRFALERQSKYIVLVPCCQAEVAAHLRKKKGVALRESSLAEIWRHPIHTREFGSHITRDYK